MNVDEGYASAFEVLLKEARKVLLVMFVEHLKVSVGTTNEDHFLICCQACRNGFLLLFYPLE